jgi:hypothetical protein
MTTPPKPANKRLLGVAAVLVAVAALAAIQHFRARFVLATVDDLVNLSPPDLVSVPPPSPAAQARYAGLIDCAKTSLKSHGLVAKPANPATLIRIKKILDEGPLQRPLDHPDNFDDELAPFSRTVSSIAKSATLALQAGQTQECAEDLVLNLRFADAVRQARGTNLAYIVMIALDSEAVTSAFQCVRSGKLSPNELRQILKVVPPETGQDTLLADDTKIEYRRSVIPMMCNVDQVKKQIVTASDEDDDDNPDQPDLAGSYDAVETARQMAQIYEIDRENALKGWADQNPDAVKIARQARTKIPLSGNPPANGLVNRWLYRLQMNASPNALGNELLASGIGQTPIRRTSIVIATRHEMLRAIIALQIYRESRGNLPNNLQTLVQSGDLKTIPMDWFTAKPLRYDPAKRVVYSEGPSRLDDLKHITTDGWTSARNYAIFLK